MGLWHVGCYPTWKCRGVSISSDHHHPHPHMAVMISALWWRSSPSSSLGVKSDKIPPYDNLSLQDPGPEGGYTVHIYILYLFLILGISLTEKVDIM